MATALTTYECDGTCDQCGSEDEPLYPLETTSDLPVWLCPWCSGWGAEYEQEQRDAQRDRDDADAEYEYLTREVVYR